MKTKVTFIFVPPINTSVTIGLHFLLLSILATIPSNTIKFLASYLNCIFQYFLKYHSYHLDTQLNL